MAVAESVEARSQSEEAYLRILERIVCLDMAPGSVVNEARLREDLKIGRTPIREALQRLARENLVRSTSPTWRASPRCGSSSSRTQRGLRRRSCWPPTVR